MGRPSLIRPLPTPADLAHPVLTRPVLTPRTLIRSAEVDGRRMDVLHDGTSILRIAPRLEVPADAEFVDARGGALLPGLHDHHLHLLAMAAARVSADCGPPAVTDRDQLARALRTAALDTSGWVRGTGYHESVAGDLDRAALDALVPDHPVRVQHRSGALWMLNSAGLDRIGALGSTAPDGRLWRSDDALREAVGSSPPDLASVGAGLLSMGITGITDATPALDDTGLRLLVESRAALPGRVTLLGAPGGVALPDGWTAGPWKLHLHDHDLPDYATLAGWIAEAHDAGRAVAVHCVTRESLLLTLAALDDVGTVAGDRIEHGAVIEPDTADVLAARRIAVVTQPGFLRLRGDRYRAEVDPRDLRHLYPWASLLAAGVQVAGSSDAPYGEADPWQVMADARDRTDGTGAGLGADERVSTAVALAGYLSHPDDPGGPARTVAPGAPADLCLLHVPLAEALRAPRRDLVRQTWSSRSSS